MIEHVAASASLVRTSHVRAARAALGVLLLFTLAACGKDRGVVEVAAPTGDRAKDRASVQSALDSVRPGGTVRFAPGTYLLGDKQLLVSMSDIALEGDTANATVLQGCTSEEMSTMGEEAFFARCVGLILTGARQSVRGLTFEQFAAALQIAGAIDSSDATPDWNVDGGHRIEGNTFRNSVTVEVHVNSDSAVVFRKNRFRNVYHAIAIMGRNVHFLENDVAAPEAARVPFGWPSIAIGVRPMPGAPCRGVRIEDNTVEGHTDAVAIGVLPPDGPGEVCEQNTVRNNTIRMREVLLSKEAGPKAGTPTYGVAIRLLNMQAAMGSGSFMFPMPAPPNGWPPAFAQAVVRDNTIEGNQIEGAKGVAIELLWSSGNRVVNNRIGAVTPFTEAEHAAISAGPFGIGPGFWLTNGGWPPANGTAIWQSKGSERNTIADNATP